MPGDTVHKRRARKDARENTERVVEAARRLMVERGAGVSMDEIARYAGVGVGTLYRCFASKDELVAALRTAACADVEHCFMEAAAGESDPRLRLRRVVVEHFRRSEQHAALLDARFDAPRSAAHDLQAMLLDLLRTIIRDGQRQRLMRPGDATLLAALCLPLLLPRTARQLARQAGSADAAAEQVAEFLLRGLAP